MATTDGLDIAPGRNQGEAVILPETTWDPVSFSRDGIALMRYKRAQKQREEEAARKKWDAIKDPLVKWDIDHQKLFLPKIEENRAALKKLLAETGGRPTDEQYAEFMRKHNDLNQQVTLSNEQKQHYDKLMQTVQTARGSGTESGQSAFDAESLNRVQAWANPWENKDIKLQNGRTVGEELQRLGATQFRAEYQGELTKLEPKWDLADKTLTWSKGMEANQPRYGKLAGSNIQGIYRGHTDEQIEAARLALKQESAEKFGNSQRFENALDDFMENTMSEKDRVNLTNNALKEAGIIDAKGQVSPTFEAEVNKRVLEQMPNATEAERQTAAQVMKKEIIDNAVEKKMYNAYYRQMVEDKFTPYEKQNININNGGGDPKHQVVVTTNKPLTVGTVVKNAYGMSSFQQRQANALQTLQMNTHSKVGNVPSSNIRDISTGEAISSNDITRGDVTEVNLVPVFTAKAKNVFGERFPGTISSEDQISQLGGWEKAVADGMIEYTPLAFGTMKRITYKDPKDPKKTITKTGDEAMIEQIIAALGPNADTEVSDVNFQLPLNEVESGLINSQAGADRPGYIARFKEMKDLAAERNSKKKKGKYGTTK